MGWSAVSACVQHIHPYYYNSSKIFLHFFLRFREFFPNFFNFKNPSHSSLLLLFISSSSSSSFFYRKMVHAQIFNVRKMFWNDVIKIAFKMFIRFEFQINQHFSNKIFKTQGSYSYKTSRNAIKCSLKKPYFEFKFFQL